MHVDTDKVKYGAVIVYYASVITALTSYVLTLLAALDCHSKKKKKKFPEKYSPLRVKISSQYTPLLGKIALYHMKRWQEPGG